MLIKTEKEFEESLSRFTKVLTFDTETSGLKVWTQDKLCGIGICTSNEETFYYPFRHKHNQDMPMLKLLGDDGLNLDMKFLPVLLKKIEEAEVLVGHNIKFDLATIRSDKFQLQDFQKLEDTMVVSRLMSKFKWDRLTLNATAQRFLKDENLQLWKEEFGQYLKANKIKQHYDWGSPEMVGNYCEKDCLATWKIKTTLASEIRETEQTRVWQQENTLIKVLFGMECGGLMFDQEYLEDRIPRLQDKVQEIEIKIFEIADYEFDVASGDQLNKALESLGHKSPNRTKPTKTFPKGKPRWTVAELLQLDNDMSALILDYRGINKMLSTYFLPLMEWEDSTIHTNFISCRPITGRISCANPNLQNQSNKIVEFREVQESEEATEVVKAFMGAKAGEKTQTEGKSLSGILGFAKKFSEDEDTSAVRRLYIAPKDYYFYFFDYSQMEMRIFVDYIKDEGLAQDLESGDFDFHDHVAIEVWGADPNSDLWSFYRSLAKNINFGLIYGIGTQKLSVQIQKSYDEAAKYKRDYFDRFPRAQKFMRSVTRRVENRGWIQNRYGRRYWIERDKAYTGVNYLVQGTSADIVKNRMIAVDDFLKKEKTKSRMVLQVHDEVDFYLHKSEHRELVPKIKEILEERQIKIYLPVDVGRSDRSWAEKRDICLLCFKYKQKKKDKKESKKPIKIECKGEC